MDVDAVKGVARQATGLGLLLLVGSRARGTAHPGSDHDFAYLGNGQLDPLALRTELSVALGTDDVDLVDLERASALFRFQSARDGVVVLESRPGAAQRYRLDAVLFWCDVEAVLRRAYDDVLAAL